MAYRSALGGYKLPTTQLRNTLLNTKLNMKTPTLANRGAQSSLPFQRPSEIRSSLTQAAKSLKPPTTSSTGSKASSANPASYNYNQLLSSNLPSSSPASATNVDNWINQMKKQLQSTPKTPTLPAHIDVNKYRTEMATIKDLEQKFGFDYSREYAERQAEIMAQAQRDSIQTSRERAEWETESAKVDLQHDFFKKYLEQRQSYANQGLNAGIAAERDLRLDMNRQEVLAEILANEQLYQQELDRNLATIDKEELAYAEQLYNERLSQGFGHALDYSRFNQSENQWQAEMAMRQRQQQVEEKWREFEWNNMSYSDRMKMLADIEKYGMDMAWERHKFDAGLQFQAGAAGSFSPGGGGGGGGNFTQFRVTSGYGPRKAPTKGASSNHRGIDFATPMNTPIGATTAGTVIHSGPGRGFGNYVAVKDSNGYVHIYAHLNNTGVKVGSKVSAGQIIGRSGNTGVSTGPHLHYEVRKGSIGGGSVNPSAWL